LEHGDSEQGLELLEQLVKQHPDVPENQLRLAEAFIALGDPDPAEPHLCASLVQRASLRRDDQQLLDQLVATAGTPDCTNPN
jgi:thioredoxin-like negative regulator of GroEL